MLLAYYILLVNACLPKIIFGLDGISISSSLEDDSSLCGVLVFVSISSR